MEEAPLTGKVTALNANAPDSTTRIDADKYWAVRKAILKAVPYSDYGLPAKDLPREVKKRLSGGIPGGGSIEHYTTIVRLDLEARGLIERVPGSRPQRFCQAE
jgi:hypothetical protein